MEKHFSIGLDCHQATLSAAILDQNGHLVREQRFANKAPALEEFVAPYAHCAKAVIEASSTSLPIYDQLCELGIQTIVANPVRLHAISDAPVKNDRNDALMLAKLLHANIVPTSYVPPRHIRELRDLVRSYATLVQQQSQAKHRIRGVLMQHRLSWPGTDIQSKHARIWLIAAPLDIGSRGVINANLAIIDSLKTELKNLSKEMLNWKHHEEDLVLLQSIPGFGPLVSRVFLSEVGEANRFPTTKQLSCYAGLVPGQRSSGETNHTTGLIKQSNAALRRAMVLAAWAAIKNDPQLRERYERMKERGKKPQKAIIAIARRLLCLAHVILTRRTPYWYASKKLRARGAPASP